MHFAAQFLVLRCCSHRCLLRPCTFPFLCFCVASSAPLHNVYSVQLSALRRSIDAPCERCWLQAQVPLPNDPFAPSLWPHEPTMMQYLCRYLSRHLSCLFYPWSCCASQKYVHHQASQNNADPHYLLRKCPWTDLIGLLQPTACFQRLGEILLQMASQAAIEF